MRRILATCLLLVILSGCGNNNDALNNALQLRSELLSAKSCTFDAEITADYGEIIYTFDLKCQMQENGDLSFCVSRPEVISGITGTISQAGGKITFDDKALFFEEISQGEITPVGAPWLMLKALRGGYIKGTGITEKGFTLQLDDSYAEDAVQLNINLDYDHLPYFTEILYNGRRIVSIVIENFTIV